MDLLYKQKESIFKKKDRVLTNGGFEKKKNKKQKKKKQINVSRDENASAIFEYFKCMINL